MNRFLEVKFMNKEQIEAMVDIVVDYYEEQMDVFLKGDETRGRNDMKEHIIQQWEDYKIQSK